MIILRNALVFSDSDFSNDARVVFVHRLHGPKKYPQMIYTNTLEIRDIHTFVSQ